jgi:hypothetical protein
MQDGLCCESNERALNGTSMGTVLVPACHTVTEKAAIAERIASG